MKTTIASFFILFALLFSVSATAQIIERGQVIQALETVDKTAVYEVILISNESIRGTLFEFTDQQITLGKEDGSTLEIAITSITSMTEVPGFNNWDEYKNRPNVRGSLRMGFFSSSGDKTTTGLAFGPELTIRMRNVFISGSGQMGARPSFGGYGGSIASGKVVGGFYFKNNVTGFFAGTGYGWVSGSHRGEKLPHTGMIDWNPKYKMEPYEKTTIPLEMGFTTEVSSKFIFGIVVTRHFAKDYSLTQMDMNLGFKL